MWVHDCASLAIETSSRMCRKSRSGHGGLSGHWGAAILAEDVASPSPLASHVGEIAGYRTFVAIVSVNYFTLIALAPGTDDQALSTLGLLAALSVLYLVLGIWGFAYAQRVGHVALSMAYLLTEFAIGMRISGMVWGGLVPLILLPLAAQAVALLPRIGAGVVCLLVVAGVSGNLGWVPTWRAWWSNLTSATAAVVFVVVYVLVAAREREARQRVEKLSAEVAQLATVNERTRLAREVHDTLGHYLTVIHVQLEAARALVRTEPDRGLVAIDRAQALARDGLAAVRQSVKALRDDVPVEGLARQLASLVASAGDDAMAATFATTGTPRPVSAPVALALHRTALEALTNVRRHAGAARVDITLDFTDRQVVTLRVADDGRGASSLDGGFGLAGIRERAEQLGGRTQWRTSPGAGFALQVELPG